MRLFCGLEAIASEHEPLASHTHFGLGGPARWVLRPRDESELATVLRRSRQAGLRVRVLGRGANLLVRDEGVPDVVVRLSAPHWGRIEFSDGAVTAGGGADMHRLVLETVRRGLSGLERMGGIPGTVGGCICMNAGGRDGEIGELVRSVRVMDASGCVRDLHRGELRFAYRRSSLAGQIVLAVELTVEPDDPTRIKRRLREVWKYKSASQPLKAHSAGCIFKNPPGMSAGRMIEQVGMKGRRVGGAEVSRTHANFIVAHAGSTSSDVLRLISRIQESVHERYDVLLELEVEVW